MLWKSKRCPVNMGLLKSWKILGIINLDHPSWVLVNIYIIPKLLISGRGRTAGRARCPCATPCARRWKARLRPPSRFSQWLPSRSCLVTSGHTLRPCDQATHRGGCHWRCWRSMSLSGSLKFPGEKKEESKFWETKPNHKTVLPSGLTAWRFP